MDFFSLKRYKKLYHNHSKHVDSFNFEKMPLKVKREFTKEEQELISQLPFIRLDDPRTLLVNERPENDALIELLSGLDNLQNALLNDIYSMYQKKYKEVNLDNFLVPGSDETYRRMIVLVLPEIFWCHGNDTVKSRLF